MKAYRPQPSATVVQFIDALSVISIERAELIDAELVQGKFDRLDHRRSRFIEEQIRHFLKNHGRRRDMPPGLERTRYILTKLTARPVYYIWFNPKFNGDRSIPGIHGESGKEVC